MTASFLALHTGTHQDAAHNILMCRTRTRTNSAAVTFITALLALVAGVRLSAALHACASAVLQAHHNYHVP